MTTLDLNTADWRFRDATAKTKTKTTINKTWRPATVPGCVHTDLLRDGQIPDPFYGTNELDLQWIEERDWEYQTTFNLSSSLLNDHEHIDLVADGLDTIATVYLNGHKLAATDNMFIGWRWPSAKKHLRAGRNELRIHFGSAMHYIRTHNTEHTPRECNDSVGGATRIRKMQCQFGWDWGPRLVTAGIWRDIRLEAWNTNRLTHVHIAQDHTATDGSVTLTLTPELATTAPVTLTATARLNGKIVAQVTRPPLWSAAIHRRFDGPFQRPATPPPSDAINRIVQSGDESPHSTPPPLHLRIPDAQLWWPAGQGAQPLYDIELTVEAATPPPPNIQRRTSNNQHPTTNSQQPTTDNQPPSPSTLDVGCSTLDVRAKRVGLRTIQLDRHPDEWGESFQFLVNGRPIFIKGANWIPAHSFVAALTRADYARDLNSAAQANLNCIRLWGGGIYENQHFYDLCDELGLLLWHDFMFSCTLYPHNDAFVQNVRAEAHYQIRRLHHHASLALWCGNNELAQLCKNDILATPESKAGYERIFHQTLPDAIAAHDGVTPYWPSSEWSGDYECGHEVSEKRGDKHFWDVWHARKPVKDYEKYQFRFVSEFGMQSYSSPQTNATFCPPGDANIFGPTMENHQKNRAGNQIILDYVSRRYRLPKSQDALIYLSQLNQAYCMQTGIEHYRRLTPRCMGAIYWQLNDCWPVASWSSIEFTGRWKALHHAARRFNAPAIASAHVPGDETPIIGNYRRSTVDEVHLYTVYDAPAPARGTLRWDLFHLDGRILLSGKKNVALRHGESLKQKTLRLAPLMERHGRDNLYLRIALDTGGRTVSQDTVFLTPPRFLALPRAKTKTTVRQSDPKDSKRFVLTFTSPVFQHRFAFDLPGLTHAADDNYFDLYPGEKKEVTLILDRATSKAVIEKKLRHQSLVDTYS